MEVTSRNLQLALGSLVTFVVGSIVALYVIGSGITAFNVPVGAGPFTAVTIAVGFLAGMLLYWRHPYAYVVSLIVGILFLINAVFIIIDIGSGNNDAEWLILMIPGLLFSLIFLGATFAAWREK